MSGLRARVENGRLKLDEPTTLPEGTVLDLVIDDDPEDDLDEDERRARDESIRRGLEDGRTGKTRPASEVIDELRKGRKT
jgi:hypothetical protein